MSIIKTASVDLSNNHSELYSKLRGLVDDLNAKDESYSNLVDFGNYCIVSHKSRRFFFVKGGPNGYVNINDNKEAISGIYEINTEEKKVVVDGETIPYDPITGQIDRSRKERFFSPEYLDIIVAQKGLDEDSYDPLEKTATYIGTKLSYDRKGPDFVSKSLTYNDNKYYILDLEDQLIFYYDYENDSKLLEIASGPHYEILKSKYIQEKNIRLQKLRYEQNLQKQVDDILNNSPKNKKIDYGKGLDEIIKNPDDNSFSDASGQFNDIFNV